MQHWLQEAPTAQPYHTIAEVVVTSDCGDANKRPLGTSQSDSQVVWAGSQGSAR